MIDYEDVQRSFTYEICVLLYLARPCPNVSESLISIENQIAFLDSAMIINILKMEESS